MPTAAATGEIYEVVLEGRQEGQQVLNVMHFRVDTPVDSIETRLLRALIVCLIGQFVPAAASTYQFVVARAKRVAPTLGPIIELGPEEGEQVQGQTAGDATPSFVSVCANIHTTRGGRSGRGRMFFPAVPEGATQGSFIPVNNPYYVAILQFLACVAGQFINVGEPLAANQISLGVMSRKIGGPKPPYDINGFAPATRIIPSNKLSHNVSRKVGRGS